MKNKLTAEQANPFNKESPAHEYWRRGQVWQREQYKDLIRKIEIHIENHLSQ